MVMHANDMSVSFTPVILPLSFAPLLSEKPLILYFKRSFLQVIIALWRKFKLYLWLKHSPPLSDVMYRNLNHSDCGELSKRFLSRSRDWEDLIYFCLTLMLNRTCLCARIQASAGNSVVLNCLQRESIAEFLLIKLVSPTHRVLRRAGLECWQRPRARSRQMESNSCHTVILTIFNYSRESSASPVGRHYHTCPLSAFIQLQHHMDQSRLNIPKAGEMCRWFIWGVTCLLGNTYCNLYAFFTVSLFCIDLL